jgi:hypothetical protein
VTAFRGLDWRTGFSNFLDTSFSSVVNSRGSIKIQENDLMHNQITYIACIRIPVFGNGVSDSLSECAC